MSVTAFLHVFSVDSLQSSHALTFPIGHQSELRQIFDGVTYYKGRPTDFSYLNSRNKSRVPGKKQWELFSS
jgi:hypothetical protein